MILDERKQKILAAVIHAHVRTAGPVASEQVTTFCDLGVKSATIRNEMAEMSEMGYLRQPHTSAGRIPSDKGYRFYVDRLMPRETWPLPRQAEEAEHFRVHSAVDDLMAATCRVLSAITNLVAMATAPSAETVSLQWLDVRRVSSDRVVIMTLWSNGQIRHSLLQWRSAATDIERAVRVVAPLVTGKSHETISALTLDSELLPKAQASRLACALLDVLKQIASDVASPEVFVDGTSCFARQPEFRENPAMELVLAVLEEHKTLARVLDAAAVGPQPQVVIGHENPLEPLRECSLVAVEYAARSGVGGGIGVCGPTRMDYARVTAAVDYVARSLSTALSDILPS